MKLLISELAEKDLAESIDFFSKQKPNLELEFITEFESALEKIKLNPKLNPIKHRFKTIDVRIFHLQKFSFIVPYVVDKQNITILSVWHTSRNPQKLKKRLK